MGTVLEFGIGAGHNLPHYDSSRIDRVIGVDPCATSWELASERAANLDFDVEFIQGSALDVPIEDASVDSVLITFTLCTVPGPMAALREAKRTLKPGGKVYFCEHGLAPDERVAKWQNRVKPIWKKVFGGCHINRDTAGLLTEAGFKLDELEQMYLPGTPTIAGFNTWGEASLG